MTGGKEEILEEKKIYREIRRKNWRNRGRKKK